MMNEGLTLLKQHTHRLADEISSCCLWTMPTLFMAQEGYPNNIPVNMQYALASGRPIILAIGLKNIAISVPAPDWIMKLLNSMKGKSAGIKPLYHSESPVITPLCICSGVIRNNIVTDNEIMIVISFLIVKFILDE